MPNAPGDDKGEVDVKRISMLLHEEPVGLDRTPLETLHRQLGRAGAENVTCRTLEDLSERLADLRPFAGGCRTDTERLARGLAGVAEQIGLTMLARVAGDVACCANRGDFAALSATLARLERIGDRSLSAIWDLQDLSV
ncbi:hypothetical protein [Tropicimonas sp.]|uniref:hypothetical protein n=1 Tax=Tropicimonas sp. TaxID=2067044 RepID=UPI003A8AC65F